MDNAVFVRRFKRWSFSSTEPSRTSMAANRASTVCSIAASRVSRVPSIALADREIHGLEKKPATARASRPKLFFLFTQLCQNGKIFQGRRVADCLTARRQIPQQPPHDLSASCLGKGVGKSNFIGLGETADGFRDVDSSVRP